MRRNVNRKVFNDRKNVSATPYYKSYSLILLVGFQIIQNALLEVILQYQNSVHMPIGTCCITLICDDFVVYVSYTEQVYGE